MDFRMVKKIDLRGHLKVKGEGQTLKSLKSDYLNNGAS